MGECFFICLYILMPVNIIPTNIRIITFNDASYLRNPILFTSHPSHKPPLMTKMSSSK